ncbi:dihydrodipicolinate synthase family protein [Domibacillus aminovorans]|uniref:Dihydrodipicolinate synthase family protein n=1 Tax=Domibacillus aminovorans TaxID=29332 RepID=A0A177KWB6_9BACI|nr:dihydrodipicolinate synthase family protein [Domibacillus aminovorans]OAH57650.1 dihydrodipicolinate synthase family protein [Domibacillus aminovorans]
MLKETFHIAVPTAFFEDESVNIRGTIDHIRDLYKQGVKSVLVSGSTGEQHSLNLKEKIGIINSLVLEEELINDMEILFGVSSIRQKEAEELAKKIRTTKISGILLGYPPYVLPTQEEALVYTKTIINLSNKPTILYNNPKRTGFNLSVNSIIQLSKIELVVGLKEAGNKEKVGLLKNDINRSNFHFYAGGEVELEEKVLQGFDRLSSIAGNISPMEISQWFNKMLTKKNITQQERVKIETIIQQVYQGPPLVNLKKSINQKGIPMGICRSPIGNI